MVVDCRWEEQGFFAPDDSATGEPFTMAMPPANVTGRLHMGHAMFVTLQVDPARSSNRNTLCEGMLLSSTPLRHTIM